jgi:hypothetical protein
VASPGNEIGKFRDAERGSDYNEQVAFNEEGHGPLTTSLMAARRISRSPVRVQSGLVPRARSARKSPSKSVRPVSVRG